MMSKQRANLRGIAAEIEPSFQIGKGDITENQVAGISGALRTKELIKINVLKSCSMSAKEAAA